MNDLIHQFKKGQQAAFTELYERYQPAIFYFVRKFVSDIGQAEDITAETFIKLWVRRQNFDNEKSISSYLHVTARNSSIDWIRTEKKQDENKEQLLILLKQEQYDSLQDDVKAEVLRLIKAEIEKLPKKIKRVFILSYIDGKSNDEIAALLKINNQSVRNHKTRALTLIRLAIAGKHWLFLLLTFLYKRF
jgi:RNA polymerase sigma-70 factor (ECF subfamily)